MASVGRSGSTIDTSLSKTAQTSGAAPSSLTGPTQQAPANAAPAPASDDPLAAPAAAAADRKSVVWGKSVSVRLDLGGLRIIKTQISLFFIPVYPTLKYYSH